MEYEAGKKKYSNSETVHITVNTTVKVMTFLSGLLQNQDFMVSFHPPLPDSDDESVDQLIHRQVILQTSIAAETPRVLVDCHGVLKLTVLFHTW